MKVIIPVAGIGKRLKPLTNTIPKVLLPVAGKPVLLYILDHLIDNRIADQFIIIIKYLGDKIQEAIGKEYRGIKVSYLVQEEVLGLGHALLISKPLVKKGETLIILGDTILEFNARDIISSERSLLGVHIVNEPERFGIAETDPNGRILKLIEKPDNPVSNLALTGIYYLKDISLLYQKIEYLIEKNIKTKNEYQLTDALQLLISDGIYFGSLMTNKWVDCGTLPTLIKANQLMLDKMSLIQKKDSVDSRIIYPSYIEENVSISRSIIGPYVSISKGTIIENSIIRNSIICNNADIRNSIISESVIGANALIFQREKKYILGDDTKIFTLNNME